MNWKILFFLVINLNFSFVFAQAETRSVRRPSFNEFSQAIGGPNKAFYSGAADIFANPALMGQTSKATIQFSNQVNGKNLRFFSTALVLPLRNNQYLGLGLFGLNVPVGEFYDGERYSLRYDDNYSLSFNFSYAYKFNSFTLGSSLEYSSYQLLPDDFSRRQSVWDASIGIYRELSSNLKLGFLLKGTIAETKIPGISQSSAIEWGGSVVWTPITNRTEVLLSLEKNNFQSFDFKYALIFKPFKPKILNKIGIKSFSLRSGSANNNVGFLNLPDKGYGFFSGKDKNLFGTELKLMPIYDITFGVNFCFPFNDLPNNITLLTTHISF